MSIDYGTEWFKVGLIKPGIPLDVALNKDSKRKTQAVVTLRDNERIYGSDAVSLAGRFPQFTYFNLKSIAGKPYNDKHSVEYRHRFVNTMDIDPERNMPIFRHNGTTELTVEELIAYQFQNAREQARQTAGEDVRDVVITVTPFATQHERQAILDAAELAGLKVLSLIHDETAVALNYAVSRQFTTTPENHVFYDMGAGSTVASVVSFSNVEVKEGKKKRQYPQIEVKAIGFDRTLGGHEFDVRLMDHLANGFMKLHKDKVKTDIRTSDGAMARLLKEANRVKQILSANTEMSASVEGLHEDIDFKMKVTRAELESMCSDLLGRVQNPIQQALAAAKLQVDDVKSVVLVGGSVRIPAVQRKLNDVVGYQRIAKNVNADEAAVLGAAFRGASLSNQFRLTKQIKIKDVTIFPIEVTYEPEQSSEEGHAIRTTLFHEFGTMGVRKIMSFKRQSDFTFDINYAKTAEEQDKDVGLDKIGHVKVTGLTAALEKHQDDIKSSENPPKVRVTIEMSDSGIVSVPEASVTIEVNDNGKATFKDKVKSFFGSKEDKPTASEQQEGASETSQATQNETVPASENNTAAENETTVQAKTTKEPTLLKFPLEVEYIPTGPAPLSKKAKDAARQRIKELDYLDQQRRYREEARNSLESFVYRTQDFLEDDVVAKVTSEKEQEHLREKLSETSDWLYDEGEDAEAGAYSERLRGLQSLERRIRTRHFEYLKREENVSRLTTSVQLAQTFVEQSRQTEAKDQEPVYTDEELDNLLKLAETVEQWKITKVAEQEKLGDQVDPVLTTAATDEKCKQVDEALMKLIRKKKASSSSKKSEKPTADENAGKNESKSDQNDQDTTEEVKEEENTEHEEQHEHDEL
ncbi:heat shock protein 70 family [Radiomyces spectabilis]|uniref:heat shock protein 70 family n=1 Tax=Radiomyces spectabilis TaxID=64574 RepID=UPI002220B569|nr:heat shock protein 70 family [Radiomyces spectabilis]KAI8388389.1 heat shock protein 70 family [Radiomyces spectabilis]